MFSLTKIDCSIKEGSGLLAKGEHYTLFNPIKEPGCVVGIFSSPARETVSGNIASKLALDHFASAITDALVKPSAQDIEAKVVASLEYAFKESNRNVYEFGHQLAAGGRMGASLMAVVVQRGIIAIGKTDSGSVYIIRNGEVVPFFIETHRDAATSPNYVGLNSLVNVEVSSLPLQSGDEIIAFSKTLTMEEEGKLVDTVQVALMTGRDSLVLGIDHIFSERMDIPVLLTISVGPEGIYLAEVA
jgi:hypothetical protein